MAAFQDWIASCIEINRVILEIISLIPLIHIYTNSSRSAQERGRDLLSKVSQTFGIGIIQNNCSSVIGYKVPEGLFSTNQIGLQNQSLIDNLRFIPGQ